LSVSVRAHSHRFAALQLLEALDGNTDPRPTDLFRVFGGLGKLRGNQRSVFRV
jgi:hypothetical protein